MAAVVIRNLPESTHRALKRQAKIHGRSTEAEIREILEKAVKPETQENIGEALLAFGRKYGGIELDIPPRTDPAVGADFD